MYPEYLTEDERMDAELYFDDYNGEEGWSYDEDDYYDYDDGGLYDDYDWE